MSRDPFDDAVASLKAKVWTGPSRSPALEAAIRAEAAKSTRRTGFGPPWLRSVLLALGVSGAGLALGASVFAAGRAVLRDAEPERFGCEDYVVTPSKTNAACEPTGGGVPIEPPAPEPGVVRDAGSS